MPKEVKALTKKIDTLEKKQILNIVGRQMPQHCAR
jgi:hypothetical protein